MSREFVVIWKNRLLKCQNPSKQMKRECKVIDQHNQVKKRQNKMNVESSKDFMGAIKVTTTIDATGRLP